MDNTEILKNIAVQLDITHLPESQQQELVDTATRNLMRSLITRSLVDLSDDDVNMLQSQMDAGTAVDMGSVIGFLATHVSDFETMFSEELADVKTDIDMVLGRYQPGQ